MKKAYAREMYLEKLSMAQIARLTGIPKSTVQRAVKELNEEQLTKRKAIRLREADTVDYDVEWDEVW